MRSLRKHFSARAAERMRQRVVYLYGKDRAERIMDRLYMLIGRYTVGFNTVSRPERWSEKDAVLITYADMVQEEGRAPLESLRGFCCDRLGDAVNCVHILPFYPWSSDDGFSVIDYRAVKPEYGNWSHVEKLGEDFDLMFDLVLNHCSRESGWFDDFVGGVAPARHYFIEMDPATDLTAVVRPRPWPLLTKTPTRYGETHVWTTFSEDQVDLNFANPDVLFEFLDILLLYISYGARILRLDAIAFLWKEIGTSCIHLPQTHEVVKLMRDLVDEVAPEVILLTETNVPHKENISYFGNGDEAHMVYQFSLPPLTLHGLLREDASHLTQWADSLPDPGPDCTYFNFTSSHDGVGVRPLQGLLPDEELAWLVEETRRRGGQVSMKANSDGSQSPYELNITYYAALNDADNGTTGINRFLCSQYVALAMKGVPGIYFHSLVACLNNQRGFEQDGQNRTLNRLKWKRPELEWFIDNPETHHHTVFNRYRKALAVRRAQPAFHPAARQEILDLSSKVFGLVRTTPSGGQRIVCLYNFTSSRTRIGLDELGPWIGDAKRCRELLGSAEFDPRERKYIDLRPFQTVWLATA